MGDGSSDGRAGYALSSVSTTNAISSYESDDPHFKLKLRQKQQRLLLLHHTATCQYVDGRCPVSSHCADFKKLWEHMESCTDTKCQVSHCYSSRAILTHYAACKDQDCTVCGPVRDSVLKCKTEEAE